MALKEYEWDNVNIEHIFKHGVVPNEAEECCYNDPLILKTCLGRYIVLGQTDAGRYLFVVAEHKKGNLTRVITARDMVQVERKLYRKKKKR